LASQLDGSIKVPRSLRDRFAAKDSQKLAAGLLQLRAPSTRSSPAIQFSMGGAALIKSLIALVSRR
jgi:hypothetical protein